MAHFIVLTRLNKEGLIALKDQHADRPDIESEVRRLGGQVIAQHALFGEYHFCTIVDLPDNEAAHRLGVPNVASHTIERMILPSIDLKLFTRLLGQTTESVGPHRWQVGLPARAVRRVLRHNVYLRDLHRWCKPFTVQGQENFNSVTGPMIVIANHSSHVDTNAFYGALPNRVRSRIAFGAAADRWFLKGRKGYRNQGWWRSLAYNTFPIKRGGGGSSLEYPKWLIDRGFSIGIFPEGTRSTTGRMSRFRVGASLLAIEKQLPIVPMYMEGLREIRPKGAQSMTPGPVTVLVGAPLRFAPGTDPAEATHTIYKAMEALRRQIHTSTRMVADAAPPAAEEEFAAAAT